MKKKIVLYLTPSEWQAQEELPARLEANENASDFIYDVLKAGIKMDMVTSPAPAKRQ